ncbi:DUF2793 domain-containing protein [Oceanicaulis sp. LC35]|uniref:DUF2793 domain-containing protein n=1 Tax=Oceanicaulis sp. LC35 TaxID=3349635 RepID=UPI003F8594BC
MSQRTPRLELPWLMPAQAQKHVTVNQALARLDILVQAAVMSRSLNAQPAEPVEGEGYILPDGATGTDWSGQNAGMLMVFHEGVWTAIPPWAGMTIYVRDEAVSLVHDGTDWRPMHAQIRKLDNQEGLGVGAVADGHNRVAIKSSGVLMSAEDAGSGDIRLALNKSAPAATSSLLFQSGWSGRAEIGLAGDDALTMKVSDDGASWREAFRVRAQDARISVSELSVQSDHVCVEQSFSPASSTSPGEAGRICWDGGHLYVCVAQDQWRRAALSLW